MNMKLLIIIFLFICFLGCSNVVKDEQPNNIQKRDGFESLIISEENIAGEISQKNKEQLLKFAKQSDKNKTEVTKVLIEESVRICNEKVDDLFSNVSRSNFNKLRSMSNILADLKSIEALDILIDCSEYRDFLGGFSSRHYATQPAILSYKESAMPTLMRKMSKSTSEIKCNIANTLAEIGGDEAKDFLIKTKADEKDKKVLECLTSCIDFIIHSNRKSSED
jgi:hypothetical protein